MMHPRQSPFLRFGRSPIFYPQLRATFTLALPLMLGELSGMLMGVASTMMVGHLGETALAGLSIATVVFIIAMLLIWGSVRMVPTPVAEAHELRDGERVKTLSLAGLAMGGVFAVVASALLHIGIVHFDYLGQDPEVANIAVAYLHCIVWSIPAMILFAVLVNLADALEYVRFTMLLSFVGLAFDVFLNWLFIFGHLGMPKWGVSAIAINMGITNLLMSVALLIFFWRKKELAYIRNSRTHWPAIWSQTLTFIRLGVPSALQIMVEFAAFGAGTIIIGQISKTQQAAHQVALNLISVTYVTIMGVSTAGMIRVGQALAYQSRVRVWLAGTSTLCLAMLIILVPTLAFLIVPGFFARLYVEETAVIAIATSLVFLGGLFQFADAAQASSVSLLRSLNDVLVPSAISFVAFWLIGIPLGYWLAVHQGWKAQGIWMGYLVALIIQSVLFLKRFYGLVGRVGTH
jgi:multidrug resistance protein, MATE family